MNKLTPGDILEAIEGYKNRLKIGDPATHAQVAASQSLNRRVTGEMARREPITSTDVIDLMVADRNLDTEHVNREDFASYWAKELNKRIEERGVAPEVIAEFGTEAYEVQVNQGGWAYYSRFGDKDFAVTMAKVYHQRHKVPTRVVKVE